MNKRKEGCSPETCRCWIDYPEDMNCALVAVEKHGALTLEETAKRLGISLVRVSQIEKQAMRTLSKRIKK
jgi:DNA-directed RNA polymerase specialized sigma24 family protein